MQKTLSWIALVGGEIVIFVAFRLWGGGLLPEIRTLNTAVSMIVLALFFVDILIPWVDWNDRSGKRLGALGLRWVATGLYAVAAVAVMLLCNVAFPTLFSTQLLIHCILLLGLVLGFSAVVGASAKVGAVHAREEQLRSGLDDLKQRVRQLQRVAAGIPDLPAADRSRIDALAGELRFMAPCRTAEAAALEKEFGEALQNLEFALPAHAMNRGAVESALARAERLCAERKTLYTN